tara:strand:- start:120 stop:521 length:402 start_codon:yes stop_codon:yes gene_type:complete
MNDQSKDEMKKYIKEWIKLDNELKPHMKDIDMAIKEINEKKKQLMIKKKDLENRKKDKTDKIVEILKSNGIDSINTKDGQLVYKKRVTKKSITKKFLTNIISDYFKDPIKSEEVTNHILNSREENVVETIQMK